MNDPQSVEAKERIISTATELFSKKGYDGAKMNEIAQAAAVSKALIYYYFPTKQSILDHIIDSFFNDVTGMGMDFIEVTIKKMINSGRMDILPDRMRFTTTEDMLAFKKSIFGYHQRILRYMLQQRSMLRIILAEALRTGEQQGALLRFFRLAETSDKNPLFREIRLADSDFDYSGEVIFRKFFFSTMPMINFIVFHEDYKKASGMDDDEMLACYLRTIETLNATYFDGNDILMQPGVGTEAPREH